MTLTNLLVTSKIIFKLTDLNQDGIMLLTKHFELAKSFECSVFLEKFYQVVVAKNGFVR